MACCGRGVERKVAASSGRGVFRDPVVAAIPEPEVRVRVHWEVTLSDGEVSVFYTLKEAREFARANNDGVLTTVKVPL